MAIAFDPEQIEDIQFNIVETVRMEDGHPPVYRYYTRPVYTEPIFAWGGGGGVGQTINTPVTIQSTAQIEEINRVKRLRGEYALRAECLLRSLLKPAQLLTLDKYGAFDVRGSEGGKFRISVMDGYSFNLMDLETGNHFCFFMHDGAWATNFPSFDQFVCQAIVIRLDEPLVRSYPQQTWTAAIRNGRRDLRAMYPWEI